MEDKNLNPNPNPNIGNTPQTPPVPPVSNAPTPENPVAPPAATPPPSPTPPQPGSSIPTPPAKSTGGKGGAIIVGGILFIFIAIVVALYFLIIRQASEPETQIPAPVEQTEPTQNADPTPTNSEEEIMNIDIEEDLEEEFTPIDEDLNQL